MFTLPNNFFGEREAAIKQADFIESRFNHLYCNVYPFYYSDGYIVDVFNKETDLEVKWEFRKEVKSDSYTLRYNYSGGSGEAVISARNKEQAIRKFKSDQVYSQATLIIETIS